jgi:lysophospholipase L1-like esterase
VSVTDQQLLQDLTRALPKSGPYLNVPPGWGLRLMRARREAETRVAQIDVWGDSIWAQGQGASDPRRTSASGLLQRHVQERWGNGGSGFLSHEHAARTGTWSIGNENGFGGGGARATAAASLTWTNIEGTRVRLFYRNLNITGSLRARLDGGAWQDLTVPTGFAVEPGFFEWANQPDVPHTIEVEWVSGNVVVHGVEARRTTGVVVNRIGQNGRAGSHYSPGLLERIPLLTRTNGSANISTATGGSFRPYMTGKYLTGSGIPFEATMTVSSATAATISANATATGAITADVNLHRASWASAAALTVDPSFSAGLGRGDLVIIALGANDPANDSLPAEMFRDGLSRIIGQYVSGSAYDYTPDFIFVLEHFGNWFDLLSRKASMASVVRSMADAVGGVLVDVWGEGRRSYKFWNDRGLFADAIHPTDAGHAAYAEPVIGLMP